MRFLVYFSMVFWVVLTVVSTTNIGATARFFAKIHLG
jgi:hypothetical protein